MSERSPQQQELDWSQLIETALTAPGHISSAYSRFYNYSFLNCINLLAQGIEPQPVATYKRWAAMGRQVVKGARAKEIIRPITIERKNDDGEVEARFLKFKKVRCIFALADTIGPELPPLELPDWDLDRALKNLDIKRVPFNDLDGNTQGYSFNRNIAVSEIAEHPLKTAAHEIGHVVLGHTVADAMAEYRTHRGVKEFQAESTAYLTLHELDQLPPETASESRGYIQRWLDHERPSDVAIRQVFAATDKILKAGRPAVEAVS